MQARNGVAHVGDDGGRADEVAQLAVQGAAEILGMMGRSLGELFGDVLPNFPPFVEQVSLALRSFYENGARSTLDNLIHRK